MKLFNKIVTFIQQSHLVVTLAATLLAYQSILFTGDTEFRNHVLLIIFCGTIFIYNIAHIIIDVSSLKQIKIQEFLKLRNARFHLLICLLSMTGFVFGLAHTIPVERKIIFFTGIFTIAYVMPFSKSNQRLKGFRNIPVVKNILLAAVWSVATAWLPLAGKTGTLYHLDLIFICLKRFFFVLPLCMIFDVRDYYHDLRNKVKTIPNQLGIGITKNFSLLALFVFVIMVYLHKKSMEATSSLLHDLSLPLYISAIITSIFIIMINASKKNAYYIFVIDGSMILQFLLVYIFIFYR